MAETKSNLITNSTAAPAVLNDVGLSGGRIRIAQDNFEVAAADFDADGDIIRLCSLPVNARVISIEIAADDMDGGTDSVVDVGIGTDAGLAAGASADKHDFFATDSTLFRAALAMTDFRYEAANLTTCGDKLWEHVGDSENPGGTYEIIMRQDATVSSPSAATLAFRIMYVID